MTNLKPLLPGEPTREQYLEMDPVEFRARFRERVHHTLEIQTYAAIHKGRKISDTQTNTVEELMEIWKIRNLPTDTADYQWAEQLLGFAKSNLAGEKVDLSPFAPKWLNEDELKIFNHVLYERRSVRHWLDKDVPDELIDKILEAGLWAAHSCNLQSIRYLVVKEKNEPNLFRGSDIPGGPVHIVLLQDERAYQGNLRMPKKNWLLDCGAAAQNVVLAAHAHGLGGCWLTFRGSMIERLRERFDIPEYIQVVTYVDVGYPDQDPAPPRRLDLSEMVFARV